MSFRTVEVSNPDYSPSGFTCFTVKSAALGKRADVTVYHNSKIPDANTPVIILLHGVYGSHWAWTQKGGAHLVLDNLIAAGTCGDFILVMPSDGLWGDGSGYVPHNDADYEKWIAEEVPLLIQTHFKLQEDTSFFIAGLSMGGYGALRCGLRYPQCFKGISAHSSITDIEQMAEFVEETWEANKQEPLSAIFKKSADIPPLRFDCGLADPLLRHNRALHSLLSELSIPHVYQEFEGGHSWEYWHQHLEETLLFFTAIIKD